MAGPSPSAQSPKMAVNRMPRSRPMTRADSTAKMPDEWQCGGQARPHQLVATPWERKPINLGTQSMQHKLERSKSQIVLMTSVSWDDDIPNIWKN